MARICPWVSTDCSRTVGASAFRRTCQVRLKPDTTYWLDTTYWPDTTYWLVMRNGLGQELERIEQSAVGENLVVEVRAGRTAGRSDVADDVAAFHRLAGLHFEHAQMRIPRREVEVVAKDDQVAVVARVRRGVHSAVRGREHRAASFRRNVDALMES